MKEASLKIVEDDLEQHCLDLLKPLWTPKSSSEVKTLRGDNLTNVVLDDILKESLIKINPGIGLNNLDYVIKVLKNLDGGEVIDRNKLFYKCLREGIKIEQKNGNETTHPSVRIFDFANPNNNNFICTNQFTVVCNRETKRMDVVLIINGLPVVVMELKNPIDPEATTEMAYHQLQTYKSTIPTLFDYNALLIASDGLIAKMGSLTANYDRFLTWKQEGGSQSTSEIEVLINELLKPEVLLDVINSFTVFEQIEKDTNGIKQLSYAKKICAYHQYYAVNKAIESTKKARLSDKRAGVIWHTQGSGKSLSMVFYTGKIVQQMNNPTIVVITDRTDLDQQLFETFAFSSDILGQEPVQAESRAGLKTLLTTSGGRDRVYNYSKVRGG